MELIAMMLAAADAVVTIPQQLVVMEKCLCECQAYLKSTDYSAIQNTVQLHLNSATLIKMYVE